MQTQGGPKLAQKLCWEAPRPSARLLSQCNGHHQLCFLGEETETGNVKDLCQEVETKHFLPELPPEEEHSWGLCVHGGVLNFKTTPPPPA